MQIRLIAFALSGLATLSATTCADEKLPCNGPGCAGPLDRYFTEEVWPKVGAQSCLTCHKPGGDAEESKFVLRDPSKFQGAEQEAALRHNREAFAQMARLKEAGEHRMLLKVVGRLDHGGEDVLKPDSTGYRILADFVRFVNLPSTAVASSSAVDNGPPFFEGVTMLDDRRLLRRSLLSLVGRLPTDEELQAVDKEGQEIFPALLDAAMREEAFYTRLREGFNDIFLTLGVIGNPDQVVLSYEYFTRTRQWYSKFDLSHIQDEGERRKAGYKLADDYRKAVLEEPMRLVDYIVRNDRPFTEIVTADYIMVSPYSARGYGCFDEVKDKFQNVEDPFEFVPVRLKSLEGRSPRNNQESATGYYPHAGLLSTFQYLRRYPTTETNRNRLRARMYYLHFLGIDALELAARVSDAAAVTAKYEIPTMQASECVVCHKTIDPVAGLFQDFYDFEGTYGRRKDGWYKDMFGPGLEGEDMPSEERWRSLQWLGERTAKDPRFAATMVEHVYYILTGRKTLLPPKELDDPLYPARRRAYLEQRKQIDEIAGRFSADGFNLKHVFRDWILSDFYRVDGLSVAIESPARRAELEDVGLARMLAPEQVERKTAAIFGEPWGKMRNYKDSLAMLYGGIDSQEVTERAIDPSGAMGAIQRMMSNDLSMKHTLRDFAREPAERRLFPAIEPDVLPGVSPEADAQIRAAVAYLHERVLGRNDGPDSPEVARTAALFAAIVNDARQNKGWDKLEKYEARTGVPNAPADPNYTIRAWRGVLAYLLRRPEFLYE